MHEFFSPDSQRLTDRVMLLPQEDAQTGPTGRPPNSYAWLFDGGAVLFDAPFHRLLPAIGALEEDGYPPAALVLSHRHVAGQGDGFDALREAFGDELPMLLAPRDAEHEQAQQTGVAFGDPAESDVLAEAGLEVIAMPYHTTGSIMLYAEAGGGTLLAGDSTVAPGPEQDALPERLERPPVAPGAASDEEQRDFWQDWDRPLRSVFPLHGAPYADRDDLDAIMRPLRENAAMRNG